MQYEYITTLLGIQGFQVTGIEPTEYKGHSAVIVDLERTRDGYRCSGCGEQVEAGYDSKEYEIQHLMWWQHVTLLRFRRYRVECPKCGVRTEALDFVDIR